MLALFGQQSFGQLKGWQGSLLYLSAAVLFARTVLPQDRARVEQVEHSIKQWPREAQQALLASGLLTGLLFIMIDTENVTGTAWILQIAAIVLVLVAGRFADRSGRTELPHTQVADRSDNRNNTTHPVADRCWRYLGSVQGPGLGAAGVLVRRS